MALWVWQWLWFFNILVKKIQSLHSSKKVSSFLIFRFCKHTYIWVNQISILHTGAILWPYDMAGGDWARA
jgi:hypothetical protein